MTKHSSNRRNGSPTKRISICQGEHAVDDCPDVVISTTLGSCVATCLWDQTAKVGGMNHILLPDSISNSGIENLHGAAAMEVLINALLKRGASKSRLRGKIFGGAQMVSGLSSIGKANGTFVRNFLRQEGIPIDAECLGGVSARRVEFSPVSGHARQKLMKAQVEEQAVVRAQSNDVELF